MSGTALAAGLAGSPADSALPLTGTSSGTALAAGVFGSPADSALPLTGTSSGRALAAGVLELPADSALPLPTVEHQQRRPRCVQAPFPQVLQERHADHCVLGRPLPQAKDPLRFCPMTSCHCTLRVHLVACFGFRFR